MSTGKLLRGIGLMLGLSSAAAAQGAGLDVGTPFPDLVLPVLAEVIELRGHGLYHVCEGVKGQCLHRRQDLTLRISAAD